MCCWILGKDNPFDWIATLCSSAFLSIPDLVLLFTNMVNSNLNGGGLCLRSLNHISMVCRSIEDSITFYENVLGFIRVKRPGSFNFNGAWLFNYGIGIHLLQCASPEDVAQKKEINPRDNHISFQCEDMQAVERRLQEMRIKYVKRIVEEGGIYVDQLFIHDPDGFMVELCNCDNFPVEPISSSTAPALCFTSTHHRTNQKIITDLQLHTPNAPDQMQLLAVGTGSQHHQFAA